MGRTDYEEQGELVRELLSIAEWGPVSEIAEPVFRVSHDTLRRLASRKRPPGVLLALRLDAYLGFPLSFWSEGVPANASPHDLLPYRPGVLPKLRIRTPQSWEVHGAHLASLIRDSGESQKRAALRFGVSRPTVRRILLGQEPNVRVALEAQEHYDFPIGAWGSDLPSRCPDEAQNGNH